MSDASKRRKTFKYRLYTGKRNRLLRQQINVAGMIWNHALALEKRYRRLMGKHIPLSKLKAHIAHLRMQTQRYNYWQQLGSQAVQEVLERLDRAYQRFFEHTAKRPPKFKKVKKFRSFTLKQAGWKLLDTTDAKGIGRIRIGDKIYKYVQHRPIEGEIKTVTIKRDSCDRLWLCFSVEFTSLSATEASTGQIGGFDFGLKTFLTDEQGRPHMHPLFFKQQQKYIAQLTRTRARKQKGSHNRSRVHWLLARAHIQTADKRRDFHFQLAHELCDEYDMLVFEDLNMESMKRLWGRKVSGLGFAKFVEIVQHVARKRGKRVVFINRFEPTTQVCSECGHRQQMHLHERIFACENCGLAMDRDWNSARNGVRIGASMHGLGIVRLAPASSPV